MSLSPSHPEPAANMSMGAIVLRFLLFLIGGSIFMMALVWGLEVLTGYVFENNSLGVLVAMIAGMGVAMQWYNAEKARPASGRAWKAAFLCSVATLALQLGLALLFYAAGLLDGVLPVGEERGLFLQVMAVVLVVVAVIQFLLIRLGLGLGFYMAGKQARQLAQKQAAK